MLMDPLTSLILIASFITVLILTFFDFKKMILPNIWVLTLACLGLLFHFSIHWSLFSPLESFFGFIVGGGFLLVIRIFANWRYKKNTLGMGDIKLMMAGGIWVGAPSILIAISIGAFSSVILGGLVLILKKWQNKDFSLRQARLPAGPGFILGLIITFLLLLKQNGWIG